VVRATVGLCARDAAEGGSPLAPGERGAGESSGHGGGLGGDVGSADAGSGLVEREQALEDLFVGEVGRSAVGGGDRGVELLVDVVEPGGRWS